MPHFRKKSKRLDIFCLILIHLLNYSTVLASPPSIPLNLADSFKIKISKPTLSKRPQSSMPSTEEFKLKKFKEQMEKYNLMNDENSTANNLAICRSGGSCGGGGSTVYFPEQKKKVLLDRLLLTPDLASKQLHEESMTSDDINAFRIAHQWLQSWIDIYKDEDSASSIFLKIIQRAIDKVPYLHINNEFLLVPRYYLPQEILDKKPIIQTAIVYLYKLGNVPLAAALISDPIWRTLDDNTKAGLLLHEGLRQIQFLYQFNDLSEKNLELIIAKIIDSEPSSSFSFVTLMSPMLLHLCQAKSMIDSNPPINQNELIHMISAIDYFHTKLEERQTEQINLLESFLSEEENINTFFSNLIKSGFIKK